MPESERAAFVTRSLLVVPDSVFSVSRLMPPRGESKSTTEAPWYHRTEPGGVEWTLMEQVRLIVLPFFTYTSSGPQMFA